MYNYLVCNYLCVILQGNDLMRMLRYHVVDLNVTGKGRHQRRSKVRSAELWQCSVARAQGLKGLRQIQICVVERAIG